MALARLDGGPLDGQIIPLADPAERSLIVPYGEGQLIYARADAASRAGEHDGPAETHYAYVEATEDIDPDPDQRDD